MNKATKEFKEAITILGSSMKFIRDQFIEILMRGLNHLWTKHLETNFRDYGTWLKKEKGKRRKNKPEHPTLETTHPYRCGQH